ncbi:MAG: glutamate-cysteine ligase family protein [Butyribacter sp.]|nr:glutamate-cysteine ligase family protein [bacterium]MDY3855101.1 glutamate-cysteine ligase family protein [Butyribacter sp.]
MTEKTELLQKQNLNKIVQMMYEGCKSEGTMNLGVELEHFIVRKDTQTAVCYYGRNGMQDILNRLLKSYPNAKGVYERGKDSSGTNSSLLMGIDAGNFSVSLEPAAQLEISISPRESICEIETIYQEFREHLDFVLDACDASCVTMGYHPYQKAEELELIPKERYRVMDAYFAQIGNAGRQMMRATASTQISIDYTSCSDFRKKYQAAYVLTPVFKFLTDCTPVYEGNKNGQLLRRSCIWEEVDSDRTGIVPEAISGEFTFRDYAVYLWNLPLVYCPKELLPLSFVRELKETEVSQKISPAVGRLTPAQIWKEEEMTNDAIWHMMSMAFPDVRLKNYIEIRGADAMPVSRVLSYAALVKGLLYNKEIIDKIDQEVQLQNITEHHIKKAEQAIQKEGKDAVVYRQNIVLLCKKLLQKAYDFLPKEEKKYLEMEKLCK